ncbi:hypothetical protein [Tetragenococcus halophilus]|uniref:Uncharacterized protein n=2 Tax=Tetragenococcus halophilus TaxID=51669 RepID=A0A2H6CK29_TETHA|nr:hypothetical protein [Tetragenococcus halophilus]AOF49688.1 hypothetical protein AC806_10020 [Tetragenococcus halophilus]MCO7026117.1 hypothetical protein [Tetragenococcus halophilus]MCO8283778.1 hypothetical protein [Tetragenococcus halophilus]MCO8286333.1 hypothetical protein [Tetragenococcus halophilus]MCO8289682.1 hypothetical protein [Tetragenococcus halophilus]
MIVPTYAQLKKEMTLALDTHIDILKDVSTIEGKHLEGVMFMMRSFGFMLDRAPKVLYEEDSEEMNFLMFQYYSLLSELKHNLALYYPQAKIQNRTLIEIADTFPTTYEKDMKQWWENLTGLQVADSSKQTIHIQKFDK